jgi:hypothetical protein
LRGETVLAELVASANAPTLAVDAASVPAEVSAPFELAWEAADADGDALSYVVEASFDDRHTWWPIAVELAEPHLQVTPETLPGSVAAWFRVQVSDGFHSSSQVIGPFAIPTHAPSLRLSSPPDGTAVDQYVPLLLDATAMDLEDGELDGPAIAWTSDRDGALGAGSWIVLESLSVGEHVVTVTSTDADGQTTSLDVHVTVRPVAQVPGESPAESSPLPPSPSATAGAERDTPAPPSSPTPSAQATPAPSGTEAVSPSSSTLPLVGGLLVLVAIAGVVGYLLLRRRRPPVGGGP